MLTLDIGCGYNEAFKNAQFHGNINVDIRKPLIRIPNFIQCDTHFLPFRPDTFDLVFFFEVIEHVESPLKALKQIRYVLKEKGHLNLTTPNGLHILKIARSIKRGFYSPHEDHISIWNLPELKQLLQKANFKHIQISYANREPQIQRRKLIEKLILFFCPFPNLKGRLLFSVAIK